MAAAPAASREPAARLFIAVWPGAAVRRRLQAWMRQSSWPAGAAAVQARRLHLTLHFLGQVPLARIPALEAALPAAAPGIAPFELVFDRLERWPHGLVVLAPRASPPPLLRLYANLATVLQGLALPVEARPYRPHVTLLRHAAGAAEPAGVPALRWPVDHYALVHSERGYRELRRWPLPRRGRKLSAAPVPPAPPASPGAAGGRRSR